MRKALFVSFFGVLTLFSLCVPCWRMAPAHAAGGQKWALLVGVDRYDSGDITPLAYAEADVRSMGAALIEAGGFPRDHVFILSSKGQGRYRASRPNVVDWLVRLRNNVGPGDTFVFFFAGHGISLERQSFVLTTDALAQPVENLKLSALDVTVLARLLSQIPATRKLIMLDACRNDPTAGRGDGDNPMKPTFARDLVLRPKSAGGGDEGLVATVFACHPGERSYEWSDKKHGFFSYFIIQGLRGAARTEKGTVTLPSLIDYLETSVPAQIRMWRPGAKQSPMVEIAGSGAMRWVLATNAGPGTTAPPTTETVTPPTDPQVDASPERAPESADVHALLVKAQEAFDAGQFAEPAGDNAIELARKARRQDPENATAKEIVERATKAYENLAKQATAQGDRARALKIYERLFALYPDRDDFMREVQGLATISIPVVHFHDYRRVTPGDLFTAPTYQNRGCWGVLKLSPQGVSFQASGGNDSPAMDTLNFSPSEWHLQFGKFTKLGNLNTDLAASGVPITHIVKLVGNQEVRFYVSEASSNTLETFNTQVLHMTVEPWGDPKVLKSERPREK